ncbi:hypothetical protein AVEN_259871-1 [Araneus ventricosus]|uniref:Uncharacterized protein n=1 Tax=Araneus ventricosus TaxID=182803 RepID=A0A4Y2DT35_ARAVE|nr:hypothetical protein AVEN_259871-1 [Araneus ventricosus]
MNFIFHLSEKTQEDYPRSCDQNYISLSTLKRAIRRSSKMEFLQHGKEKPIVQVENLSNLEQMIRNGRIQKNLKSKTPSADSNFKHRCEGSGETKDLPTLAPRVEAKN